jgi:hypothetical protein
MKTLHIGFAWLFLLMGEAADAQDNTPRIYRVPSANLITAKRFIAHDDPSVHEAFFKLLTNAQSALSTKPTSVMDKAKVAASGDKHDYFSFAPYWWPDKTKPKGFPYVRQDGFVNPESKVGTDATAFSRLSTNVETLAYAYYFTGREAFAVKAAELIRVWFLNPATAMRPIVAYAQAVPGINDGRFEGIIEMRQLTRITDAIALLEASPAWTAQDRAGFRHWLEAYYEWLTHNKLSTDPTSTENNHISWRDVQIVQFSLVLGKTEKARSFLQTEFPRLLELQIATTGEQDHELARTDSLGYSLFNLEALFELAILGDAAGVDCWNTTSKNHSTIYTALNYLAPYTDPAAAWPDDEIEPADRKRLLPLLIVAYTQTQNTKYKLLLDEFCGRGPELWRLTLPYPTMRKNTLATLRQ